MGYKSCKTRSSVSVVDFQGVNTDWILPNVLLSSYFTHKTSFTSIHAHFLIFFQRNKMFSFFLMLVSQYWFPRLTCSSKFMSITFNSPESRIKRATQLKPKIILVFITNIDKNVTRVLNYYFSCQPFNAWW